MSWHFPIHEESTTKTKVKNITTKNEILKIDDSILPENQLFAKLFGQNVLLTMVSDQLNILGQTFRPIFCGKVAKVTNGFITLDPVIIKMSNAPFFRFPTQLSFPIERIANFLPFDCETQFPIP
ncbi:MAG: hypothetical protein JG764_736 [Clostridiales bacterium]|jgi:hypothetical protein|nr:hypothetical protein [Clostridiales bacterium]